MREKYIHRFLQLMIRSNGSAIDSFRSINCTVSITQEMQDPVGVPQGKYWITRIPTTLTILQDSSTGLSVDPTRPLPIFPESNPENCENPEELETETAFRLDEDAQLSASNRESTLG